MNQPAWKVSCSILWLCAMFCLISCSGKERQIQKGTLDEQNCQVVVQSAWGDNSGEVGYAEQYGTVPPEGPTVMKVDVEGNIYIVDKYNYRVAEFDASGNFVRDYQPSALPDKGWIEDVAIHADGRVALGIMTPRWHLTSIHVLDRTTRELINVLEWEHETGKYHSGLVTFGRDVQADLWGNVYACFSETYYDDHSQHHPGVILQYNKEDHGSEFWQGYWETFIPGWDGFDYIHLSGLTREGGPHNEQIIQIDQQGNVVNEILIETDQLADAGIDRLGTLLGVDEKGTMYFREMVWGENVNQEIFTQVISSSEIASIVEMRVATSPYHVARTVDKDGNIYIIHYDRYLIPNEPFEIWRCSP